VPPVALGKLLAYLNPALSAGFPESLSP
jgi:hypothetical protein